MRLMIVDDEDIERNGLSERISRFGLELEICSLAWNGREALSQALTCVPDIVITDVRMPVMDGIEFARRLRSQQPSCFIIFISGFEDFHAAREALSLGASAWLVKPVNCEDLRAVLEEICDTAQEHTRKAQEDSRRDRKLEELLPLGRQEFIRTLLQSREAPEDSILEKQASELNIQLFPGSFAVMVAEVQNKTEPNETDAEKKLISAGKEAHIAEILETVIMPGTRLAYVLALPEIAGEKMVLNRMEIIANQILLHLSAATNACIGLGVSLIGNQIGGIGMLYDQACSALNEKLHYGQGRVIYYNETLRLTSSDRGEQIIMKVKKIVKSELDGNLSAEAVAARVYLTESHLRRVFKNRTGLTLQDYILRCRMEQARELLREPGNKVNIVAPMVGYDSPSYFCLVFKRFFGITPGEFRTGMNFGD